MRLPKINWTALAYAVGIPLIVGLGFICGFVLPNWTLIPYGLIIFGFCIYIFTDDIVMTCVKCDGKKSFVNR